MIYCQLNERVSVPIGEALTLEKVARVIAPAPTDQLPVFCPDRPGVWKITALDLTLLLRQHFPDDDVTCLGADTCYVHRTRAATRDHWQPLRTAAAFLILMLGSAMGLAWFHSDVDMPKAQLMVYELLAGHEPEDARSITVPYVIGVAAGVAVFYSLPSRSRATPMEVKLSSYLSSMEQTEGRDLHEG